jgi:Flp pilus assembly protein TadD
MEDARYRRLLLVAALVVLATLVNPWGPETLWIIFRTQAHQWTMANIAEWQRTYQLAPPFTPDVYTYWAWLALAGLGFAINFRRVDLNQLLLALGFLVISLLAFRNIALFALVALPITARNFSLAGQDLRFSARLHSLHLDRLLRPARVAAVAGLVGFCLWLSWFVITDRFYLAIRNRVRFGWGLSSVIYPWPMLDFLVKSGIPGPIFNNHDLGGFLIWSAWPGYRVFLDSRAFIYDPKFMEDYDRALREAPAWKALVDRYQFKLAAVLHPSLGNDHLLSILAHDPDWTPVYLDETGVVFARLMPESADWIARHRLDLSNLHSLAFTAPARNRPRPRLFFFTAKADPVQVADAAFFFLQVDQNDPAETLCLQALQIDPGNAAIMSNLAGVDVRRGQWAEAETWGRRAVAKDPRQIEAWIRLGDALFHQQRLAEAVRAYGEALRLDPRRYAALDNRGAALGQLGRYPEAAADLEQALRLQPQRPRPWCNLAYVYERTGNPRAADTWRQCLAGLIRTGAAADEISQVRARLPEEAP